MSINISIPDVGPNLHPQITVLGVGGSGGNAVNNMINSNLEGVDFAIANTDAQALQISNCKKKIQLGINSARGLGAGMRPDMGRQAAEETLNEVSEMLEGSHMLFIAAGMGGGTGTGAAPVIAKLAREKGILTVGVVTKPFHFEGSQRMKLADKGIEELQQYVDTLLIIPNQNLFRIANEKTTFADAFKMADDVLYAGVRGVTDLMVQPGLINLDFSDVKTVMSEMGKAMMGTGEASGEGRAIAAAEAAIANPLIDDVSLKGAKGLIINITGGNDITLYEVDEAANRIKQEVDEDANIIYGTTCDERLEGVVRVSLVATGIDANSIISPKPLENITNLAIDNTVYKKRSIEFNETQNIKNETEVEEILNQEIQFKNTSEEFKVPPNIKIENDGDFNDLKSLSKSLESNDFDIDKDLKSEDLESEVEIENLESEVEIESLESEVEIKKDINSENFNDLQTSSSIEVNITDVAESSSNLAEENSKPSVRRLSLFDSLDNPNDKQENDLSAFSEKTEPNFSEESNSIQKNLDSSSDDVEFSGEEIDSDENFNQEIEEELLDIPTFLRRQAN